MSNVSTFDMIQEAFEKDTGFRKVSSLRSVNTEDVLDDLAQDFKNNLTSHKESIITAAKNMFPNESAPASPQ